MARIVQILKFITVIAFALLFIVLVMHFLDQQLQIIIQRQYQTHTPSESLIKDQKDLKLDYEIKEPSLSELMIAVQKKVPNLPIEYLYRQSNQTMEEFENCSQCPALEKLNFYNTYWQTFYAVDSIFQLFGAYYDERPINTSPVVRILAMTNYKQIERPMIYCQLWFKNDNRPVLTRVKEFEIIWHRVAWGLRPKLYYPCLITCELPKNLNITGDPIPKVVGLAKKQSDTASNSLRVIYDKPKKPQEKQKFAVCVKGLDFPYEDLSSRLVEWFEFLKLMEVHKVFMYQFQVHKNISKVLNYYQDLGFVEVQNISLVGGVVGQSELEHYLIKYHIDNKRHNELIPYNDCFYRNLYKYEYIALLDFDEVIMPKNSLKSWQQLVNKALNFKSDIGCPSGYASLCFTNIYFPSKEVPIGSNPTYMYMLNHGYRLYNYTQKHYAVKCLHNTQHVISLHNHYPISYSRNVCWFRDLSTSDVQLQHYKDLNKVPDEKGKSHKFYYDDSMERFRKPLIERCTKVLKELKFIS